MLSGIYLIKRINTHEDSKICKTTEAWRGDCVAYPYISALLQQQGHVYTSNDNVDAKLVTNGLSRYVSNRTNVERSLLTFN